MVPKVIKKILVSLVLGLILLTGIVPSVHAQSTSANGPWYNQNFVQWSAKVFDESNQNEIFGERYTYAQVNWIVNSLIAVVIGSNITSCIGKYSAGDLVGAANCLQQFNTESPVNNSTPSRPVNSNLGLGGAVGGLAYLTNALIDIKPASGVEYVKNKAVSLHIIPQAYAQTGVGFNTLTPIQSLWGVVRDISYALMVVVIMVMAFMIMFRVKISPQVVISVQSALPKVAIALVLITFSYAIAGFLADLMYVVIGAFAAMIGIGGQAISTSHIPDLFTQLVSGNGLVSITVGLVLFTILLSLAGFAFSAVGLVGSVTVIGLPVGVIGGLILLIGAVFILFILFRLFWLMVKTACISVILIIIGPVMILTGTLTATGGFWGWVRALAANLAVYPTVVILIFLSHYFFWGWFAPQLLVDVLGGKCGNASFNTFCIRTGTTSGVVNLPGMPVSTNVLGFFLAFVTLFLVPKAADVIQGIISGKGVPVAGDVREAAGPFIRSGQAGLGYVTTSVENQGMEAARDQGVAYEQRPWVSVLRTIGVVRK